MKGSVVIKPEEEAVGRGIEIGTLEFDVADVGSVGRDNNSLVKPGIIMATTLGILSAY